MGMATEDAAPLSLVPRRLPSAIEVWTSALDPTDERRVWCERRLREISEELAPVGAIENLLVERVLICWLALEIAEGELAGRTTAEHSRRSGKYWSDRVAASQVRYLAAVKVLAQVQRLNRRPSR